MLRFSFTLLSLSLSLSLCLLFPLFIIIFFFLIDFLLTNFQMLLGIFKYIIFIFLNLEILETKLKLNKNCDQNKIKGEKEGNG